MSFSSAAGVANKTLENFPGHWAGVINLSGAPPPEEQILKQKLKIFLFVGDKDTAMETQLVKKFELWATGNNVRVTVVHDAATFHDIEDTDVDFRILLG